MVSKRLTTNAVIWKETAYSRRFPPLYAPASAIQTSAPAGEDEFLLLVDGEIDLAFDVAERIRAAVADACNEDLVSSDCGEKVTVSCGVAQYADADTLDSLIVRADKAMYESKAQGKDKVIKG